MRRRLAPGRGVSNLEKPQAIFRMRKALFPLAAAGMFACFSGPIAAAAEPGAIANLATGCMSCHGEGGVSQTQDMPSIAAQPGYFTQWQLVFFRSGNRKSESMNAIAQTLSNDDIRDLSGYFQSLPPPKPPAGPDADPGLTAAGAKLAVELHCKNCHGPQYHGQQAAARIAGQREQVLLKALRDYKGGQRVGSGLAAMAEVAYGLDEASMKALAHYLSRAN
jgi:cytochrome c553